jgi:hypothetical protein
MCNPEPNLKESSTFSISFNCLAYKVSILIVFLLFFGLLFGELLYSSEVLIRSGDEPNCLRLNYVISRASTDSVLRILIDEVCFEVSEVSTVATLDVNFLPLNYLINLL